MCSEVSALRKQRRDRLICGTESVGPVSTEALVPRQVMGEGAALRTRRVLR
jgi:hypothetical protein